MDIFTLELFDVTVSAALKDINRALEEHPTLPLRIHLGADEMLHHNILRFLERHGRISKLKTEGGRWRIDVPAPALEAASPQAWPQQPPAAAPAALPPRALPFQRPAPPPPPQAAPRPLLLTRSHLGQTSAPIGRRLLLGVLRELEPGLPWVGLALDGLELLEDPLAMRVLMSLQAQGTPVRISRESQLFPMEPGSFEIMEDSQWQRLAGRGEIIIL